MPKFLVPIRAVEVYELEITADSEAEAKRMAIENIELLPPDDKIIEMGKIQNVTPPTASELEAEWEMLQAEAMHPFHKQQKAISLAQKIQGLLDLDEYDDGAPDAGERDRLEFLKQSIMKGAISQIGDIEGMPGIPGGSDE